MSTFLPSSLFFLHNLYLYGLAFMVMVATNLLRLYGYVFLFMVFMVLFCFVVSMVFGLQYGLCFRCLNMFAILVMVAKDF